jgi:hypothetical protein
MSYFDQYSGAAGGFANQYGIPQPIFFGLIQQESSWNPFADAPTSSAYGFTQLLKGTASDLGVNRMDPIQNLQGGARYLASMPGSNWTEKLAHYYQGPGAKIGSDGLAYANGVLDKAKKMFGLGGDVGDAVKTGASAAACAAGDPMACMSAAGGLFGFGGDGDGCGTFDFICKLRKWITESEFFTRLALATLALLFILGGLYLMKERS